MRRDGWRLVQGKSNAIQGLFNRFCKRMLKSLHSLICQSRAIKQNKDEMFPIVIPGNVLILAPNIAD